MEDNFPRADALGYVLTPLRGWIVHTFLRPGLRSDAASRL